MTRIHHLLAAACLAACILLAAGCSGSDEAKKEQKQPSTGEFGTVSSDSTPAPKTPAPADASQKEKELPSSDAENPSANREREQSQNPPQSNPPSQNPPQSNPPSQNPSAPPAGTRTGSGLAMWSVQIGAFKSEAGATQCANEARGKFNQPIYKDYDPVTGFYKVTVGSFSGYDQAGKYKLEVQSKGYPDAFTVEVKR